MKNPALKIVIETAAGVETGELENAQNISFTRVLSSVGELSFTIPHDDPKFLLLTGLRSHIKVVREGVVVWKGVYDYFRETPETYTIFASTYESLLNYYLVAPTTPASSTVRKFASKKLGTEVAQVLFNEGVAVSGSLLTGFTLGTIENPYTDGTTTEMTSDFEFNYETLFDAITLLAQAGGADFEVTTTKAFNFLRRKGATRSNVVFHYDLSDPSNIKDYRRDVDFRKIGNDIYVFGVGVSANFLKGNTTDATSITTYGKKQKSLGMPKVLVDQKALDKLVADQIKVQKEPDQVISPNIVVDTVGFFNGWDIGDNVTITINNGSTVLSVLKRIIGVNVSYSETHAETVYLYLGEVKS